MYLADTFSYRPWVEAMSVFLEPCLKEMYMSGYHKTKCVNSIERVFWKQCAKIFLSTFHLRKKTNILINSSLNVNIKLITV